MPCSRTRYGAAVLPGLIWIVVMGRGSSRFRARDVSHAKRRARRNSLNRSLVFVCVIVSMAEKVLSIVRTLALTTIGRSIINDANDILLLRFGIGVNCLIIHWPAGGDEQYQIQRPAGGRSASGHAENLHVN